MMSDDRPPPPHRYVCAHNGDRDSYQVALALHQAGRLQTLVTDLYLGEALPRGLPARYASRTRHGLPRRRTHSSLIAFGAKYLLLALRIDPDRVFGVVDGILAWSAGLAAWPRRSGLFCYSQYLPPAWLTRRDAPTLVFQFHPHAGYVLETLRADAALYPEVAGSFRAETDSFAGGDTARGDDAWRRADGVICASTMTQRSLIAAGCPADRITILPYGADLPDFHPPGPGPAGAGTCRYLFVGQGVQRKGLHHLVRAWQGARLADAQLTIVAYRIDPGIRALIDDPSITVLGFQTADELDKLYAQADVFVMPSLVEGFGLVYLEALARGCFVIGTANTGVPDLALPPDVGATLAAGDIAALAAELARASALKRDGLLDRTRARAVAEHWSWARFRDGVRAFVDTVEARRAAGDGVPPGRITG